MSSPLSSPIPLSSELEAILRAVYNGFKYGIKIRLPHAFIMTFLFRRDLSSIDKLRMVLKLSFEHSRNLGAFAGVYKTILVLLKYGSQYHYTIFHSSSYIKQKSVLLRTIGRLLGITFLANDSYHQSTQSLSSELPLPSPPGLPQSPLHSFLAGLVGGYTIWGNPTSINYQIVLYLLSRIIMGSLSLAKEKVILHKIIPSSKSLKSWTTFDDMYPFLAAGVWAIVMVLFEEYPHVLHPSLRRSMDEIYKFAGFGGEEFPGEGQALGGAGGNTGIKTALFTTGTSNLEFIEEE